MKIFADNEADKATVSSADATVNYPASNVQDSRLSRIYRGDESIDFDISGSGGLKNISDAYSNLVQDPTDLTTGNWVEENATASLLTDTILSNTFSRVTGDGIGTTSRVIQDLTLSSDGDYIMSLVIRQGSATQTRILFYDGTLSAQRGTYVYTWGTDSFIVTAGSLIKNTKLDDTTRLISWKSTGVIAANDNKIFLQVETGTNTNYSDFSMVSVTAGNTNYPFFNGSKTADVINETFTMPDRFTFDIIITPFFNYDTAIYNSIFTWRVSSTVATRLTYNPTSDKFEMVFDDDTYAGLLSMVFDDGTSFTNINQRIRMIGSYDTVSGDINGSRFIVIPLESGSLFEDDIWSTTPDIKTSDFTTISIGNSLGASQANCEYEYLRFYEGLLVGDVTSSTGATELLKDKKLLFDKTYQQKLTATDILIANSTINDGDVITLRAGDTDSFGAGTPLDQTITWSKLITKHTFTKSTYQYWRLSVNSSNIIDIGRIYLGESYVPPGISPTITHDKVSASQKSISVSGQSYLDRRYLYQIVSTTFPSVTHAQKEELSDLLEIVDIGDPFFVEFDETCSDLGTLYVTLNQESFRATLLNNPNYYTVSFSVREEV